MDAEGYQTTMVYNKVGRQIATRDAENRRTQARVPYGIVNRMTYRTDGLRVKKIDARDETVFVWDGANLLLETAQSEVAFLTQATYTWQPLAYGKLISQRRIGGTSNFYHFDGLGSTDRLTNAAQTVTDTYCYSAYGELLGDSGDTVNPYLWVAQVGYFFDEELEQYYVRARHYEPMLARWLSKDPLGYAGSRYNLYEYAESMPSFWTDAYGLAPSWSPEDCPTQCKDSDWDKTPIQSSLKKRENEIYPPGSKKGDIIFVRTIEYSSNCGAGGLSLTCAGYQESKGKIRVKVVVCIQTKSNNKADSPSTCDAMAALEHEAVHVNQIANYLNGTGPNPFANRQKVEEEAYRKQCEIQADQLCKNKECLGENQKSERDRYIDDCVKNGIPNSTSSNGIGVIGKGCAGWIPKFYKEGLPDISQTQKKMT